MPPPNAFIEQYEVARTHLLKAIELVEAGKMASGERSKPGPLTYAAKQWLEGAKKQLAVLDRLIRDAKQHLRDDEQI
jgi:hypothetical protein